MSGKNDKNELNEYLSGDSRLSRAYKEQPESTPSSAIDEAVRAAARREVDSRPGGIINPFGRHWSVPASLAAILLLSIGLVMFMSEETGMSQYETRSPEGVMTGRDTAPASASVPGDDTSKSIAQPRSADHLREKKEAGKTQQAGPALRQDERDRSESEQFKKRKPKAPVEKSLGNALSDNGATDKPAKAPAPALMMEMDAQQKETQLAPEAWLQKINQLRKQGKTDEADASLARFRKTYPDHPLDSLHKQAD